MSCLFVRLETFQTSLVYTKNIQYWIIVETNFIKNYKYSPKVKIIPY